MDKDDVRDVFLDLVDYYNNSRGAGHTDTLKRGVDNRTDAFVITGNQYQNSWFTNKTISLSSPSFDRHLRGIHAPLAFDNSALQHLFSLGVKKIDSLEKKRVDLVRERNELRENNKKLYENKALEKEMGELDRQNSELKAENYCLEQGWKRDSVKWKIYMRKVGLDYLVQCEHKNASKINTTGNAVVICHDCGLEGEIKWY